MVHYTTRELILKALIYLKYEFINTSKYLNCQGGLEWHRNTQLSNSPLWIYPVHIFVKVSKDIWNAYPAIFIEGKHGTNLNSINSGWAKYIFKHP